MTTYKKSQKISNNNVEENRSFRLDAETDEEAENWINVYSVETRSKFTVKSTKDIATSSQIAKVIQYKCVIPNCNMCITLSILRPEDNEDIKYRIDFKGDHEFAKCTQILRPFDPNLKNYNTRNEYNLLNNSIPTFKYSINDPIIYDVETTDRNEVLQWLRYFQVQNSLSFSIRMNDEENNKNIVANCSEKNCSMRIRMKLLDGCYRVVEMGKHSHEDEKNSLSTHYIPTTLVKKDISPEDNKKSILSGLPSKNKRKPFLKEEIAITENDAGFPLELQDPSQIVTELEETVPLREYHSEMEMLCDRTNSDYFVIDPLKMYLFTTHMMRQAAAHSCSRVMVYIGTTKHEIVYGFYLTIISTKLPTGVYPILMAFHTEESVDQYITLLNSILSKYPGYFGGSKYPNYVMMDGNFAGFGAVEAVFRQSKIFICPRLTLTTLKSIASNIHDVKLRSTYNDLTGKVINNPDRVESDRALYMLLNGPTSNLSQVKEFMDIIDGYPGQVRICDRVGLGIGDRHTNNITLVVMQMVTASLLEGQNFFTVDGAIYWIIKELDLRLFAKFVQNVQGLNRNVNKMYVSELKTIKDHRTLPDNERPTYELTLTDDSQLIVYGNQEGCPCLTALKAEMCGHILYLVQKGLYIPSSLQPLVCKAQLLEEELLFLKNRFNPGEINFKTKMDPVEIKPDWRPELRPSVSFSAILHDNKFFTMQIIREMVDVLNRLPMEELRTRLLGTAKVVQMLSTQNKIAVEGADLESPNKTKKSVSYFDGKDILGEDYIEDFGHSLFMDENNDKYSNDGEFDEYQSHNSNSLKRRGRPSNNQTKKRQRKNDVLDFDGLPPRRSRVNGLGGPSTSYSLTQNDSLEQDLRDISLVIDSSSRFNASRQNNHGKIPSYSHNFETAEMDYETSQAVELLSSEIRGRERPKIQPVVQRRINQNTIKITEIQQRGQNKPFLDLDDELTLRTTINELRD